MMGQCKHNIAGICAADKTLCTDAPWCGGSVAWEQNIWAGIQQTSPPWYAQVQSEGKDLFS